MESDNSFLGIAMKYLNLGCGSHRPKGHEWTNVDQLSQQLPDHEVGQLKGERNYLEMDISKPLEFPDEEFHAILMAHVLEHFSVQPAQSLLRECLRVLKPGGVIMVSVPDAEYFRHVFPKDKGAPTWQDLYGVSDPPNPIPTWMQAALYFDQHYQVFSEETLWCALTNAGFTNVERSPKPPVFEDEVRSTMASILDRIPFSLVFTAQKW